MTTEHRTTKWLQAKGLTCWKSTWHVRRRNYDLAGFIDLVCPDPDRGLVAIQTTDTTSVSKRRKKIIVDRREDAILWLRAGGIIEVHGWKPDKAVTEPRVVEITLADFAGST